MSSATLSPKVANLIVSETQQRLDLAMVPFDIWGSRAHVIMLSQTGILDRKRGSAILEALNKIEKRYEQGEFSINPELGAQLTLEREIVELAGEEAGLSTHTARSRNDQVMVTELLYLRSETLKLLNNMPAIFSKLLTLAEEHLFTVMPGYTHMQPGKATTFSQWCLAYHDGFKRGAQNLFNVLDRYNLSPLGAVESFGTSWPIDRELTAKLLGFDGAWEIPQEAISARGFSQLELIAALNAIAITGSRLATDLLLYTTFEFGTVTLGDGVAKRLHPITGSSVMPQKRNPDVLELIRAVAPQVASHYQAASGLLSAIPSGYNRDVREIKEYIYSSLTKTFSMLGVITEVLSSIVVNKERMHQLVLENFSLATELSDFLAQNFRLPYRKVYRVVGEVVNELIANGLPIGAVTSEMIARHGVTQGLDIRVAEKQLKTALDPENIIKRRTHVGGAGRSEELINTRLKALKEFETTLGDREKSIQAALEETRALALKMIGASL